MMTKSQLLTVLVVGKSFLTLVIWDEEHWQAILFVLCYQTPVQQEEIWHEEGADKCFYCHGEIVCSWVEQLS